MSKRVGTLEWARRTGGRLSVGERLGLLAQGMAGQIRAMSRGRRRALGLDDEALAGVELPAAPDSAAAREAAELCEAASSPALVNHCLRTYLWGALLGRRSRLAYDEELLYVASLLHDLGLTDRYFGKHPDARCFGVEGAWAAADFAEQRGWEPARRDALAEAICLHLNAAVEAGEHGAEAHLLHAGAGFDVIGRRFGEVPKPVRAAVLERHPRLGFKRELDGLMRAQVAARPGCRIHLWYRYGGFGKLVAAAPFAE